MFDMTLMHLFGLIYNMFYNWFTFLDTKKTFTALFAINEFIIIALMSI